MNKTRLNIPRSGAEVVTKNLSVKTSERIVGLIAETGLEPGETLPSEAKLCAKLGVSRIVVRESIKLLQGQGLLELINGRGAVLREPDDALFRVHFEHALRLRPNSVFELMELRSGIEAFGAGLAATRRSSIEAREIVTLAADMEAVGTDAAAFVDLDIAFHVAIAVASRNEMLSNLLIASRSAMHDAMERGLKKHWKNGDAGKVHELHHEIANAIADGDPTASRLAMDNHFHQAVEALLR